MATNDDAMFKTFGVQSKYICTFYQLKGLEFKLCYSAWCAIYGNKKSNQD